MACKDCKFWDHKHGRNAAGAAVYAASCLYQFEPPVVPDSMWHERIDLARWASKLRHGTLGPKEGSKCPTFRKDDAR